MRTVVWHEKLDNIYTGRTFAVIQDGDMRYIGISVCSFRGDQFSRKMGYQIATGRARHMMLEYLGQKAIRNKDTSSVLGYPLMHRYNIVNQEDTHSEIPNWMLM